MAEYTLLIYRDCKITPEKNCVVDNIASYLSTLSYLTIGNFQYQKIELDMSIKVNMTQDQINYYDNYYNYNYCRMYDNSTGTIYYFFITERHWKSANTVEFKLKLDTLNTFQGKYTFNDKTTIQREHKDRWKLAHDIDNDVDISKDEFSFQQTGTSNIGTAYLTDNKLIGISLSSLTVTAAIYPSTTGGTVSYTYDSATGKFTITVTFGLIIPSGWHVDFHYYYGNHYARIIDEESEGFNVPLWNTDEEVLTQQITNYYEDDNNDIQKETIDAGENTWYLTYKTNTAYDSSKPDDFIYNNAINCYLTTDKDGLGYAGTFASTEIALDSTFYNTIANNSDSYWGLVACFPTGADGKKMPNSFSQDFPEIDSPITFACQIIDSNNNVIKNFEIGTQWVSVNNHKRMTQWCLRFQADGSSKFYIHYQKLKRDNFPAETSSDQTMTVNVSDNYKLRFGLVNKVVLYGTSDDGFVSSSSWYKAYVNAQSYAGAFTGTSATTLTSFKSFDKTNRTDQQLVKIINMPYCPIDLAANNLVWNTTLQQLTLNINAQGVGVYDPKFTWTTTLNINDADNETFAPYLNIKSDTLNPQLTDTKNIDNESKLLHSDFYYVSCAYDSFNYLFRSELLDVDKLEVPTDNTLTVDYCVSNSVGSAFGLDFSNCFPLKKNYQNYNVMVVNRNLEMPIYNNYYLNYLRNGYNYDVKNKHTTTVANGIGLGISTVGTITGAILSAIPATAGAGHAITASSIAGLAGSLTSTIASSVQADQALQQKLEQARNQGSSVSGADDIGLLKWYANNNLCKLIKWECSDNTKEKIFDLFYYCGYICNYQAVPDTTSRSWFNFVQCEPMYATCYVPENFKNDITEKYKAGVTVYHKQNNTWDFEQTYENWENSLLN